jgi:hypothetical protein
MIMGIKLLWTGLTIMSASAVLRIPAGDIVGAIFMIIGLVLLWLDK